MKRSHLLGSMASVYLTACLAGGDPLVGLGPSNPNDTGPRIVWDLFAEPLPEIPFPNDVGTRADLTSATGRRINVSLNAVTAHERKLRRLINELEGFGTYAPLWLRFDGRLDLEELLRVQGNADPSDDAVYVVNLNPRSADYGQPMLLDFGDGRFPITLERTDNYFRNDPRAAGSNLVFETEAEVDANANGQLDPEEDTDGDGVSDLPNLWGTVLGDPNRLDRFRDLISFYELETDTLVIRTVFPRDELSTYAVIVTRQLRGVESDSPVRSPFAAVNHTQQTAALRPLIEDGILDGLGIDVGDIAFAWTFTTQATTAELEALRAGLHGRGPFARLGQAFPPVLATVPQIEDPAFGANPYVLTTERLLDALSDEAFLSAVGLDPDTAQPTLDAYRDYVAYFAMGRFESPALIDNDDGVFRLNRDTGELAYGRETIYLACAVPRTRPGFAPPFPVMFYSHGYTSSRFELLGFGGSLARFGIATCSIDAYGHGLPASDLVIAIVRNLLLEKGLTRFAEEVFASRARDLNSDGATDSGGDFWTSNTFHTRDVVRQSAIDYFQAIRVMRQFGVAAMPADVDGDGRGEVAGDFNGDGLADLGGDVPYFIFGQSLGGIMSGVVGPLEPAVVAAAPGSGGGGLVDLALRSRQGGVVQAVYLPLFGPLLIGRPGSQGRIELCFDLLDVNDEEEVRFARVPDPAAGKNDALALGDRVRVVNLDNGEVDEVVLREPSGTDPVGLFRAHIPADRHNRLRVELWRAGGAAPYRTIDTFETADLEEVGFQGEIVRAGDALRVLQDGFGHRRGTPAFRRLFSIAQMVVDAADPISFARLHAEPVAMRPDRPTPTNLLVVNTVGDMNVPINTGIAHARAAGLIGVRQLDPRYGKSEDQVLIDNFVIEGLEGLRRFDGDLCHHETRTVLFDVDEASTGLDPQQGPHLSTVSFAPACDGSPSAPAGCAACVAQPPLRATRHYDWGVSGMRIPYVSPSGKHGFETPDPYAIFDYNTYQINQIGWFFATGGTALVDDPCLADGSCSFMSQP